MYLSFGIGFTIAFIALAILLYFDFGRDRGANFNAKILHTSSLVVMLALLSTSVQAFWQVVSFHGSHNAGLFTIVSSSGFTLIAIVLFVSLIKRRLNARKAFLKSLPILLLSFCFWITFVYPATGFGFDSHLLRFLIAIFLFLPLFIGFYAVYTSKKVVSFFRQFLYE